MSLKLDTSYLAEIMKSSLDIKTRQLTEGLRDSLDSPVFSWGSVTHRKNGEVVSDPRNAIDTGNLQSSISMQEGRGLTNKITFEADYAEKVLQASSVDFVDFTVDRLK